MVMMASAPPHRERLPLWESSVGGGAPSQAPREMGWATGPCSLVPFFRIFTRMGKQVKTTAKRSSEAQSLIAPICYSAVSPRGLPGCLPQTLSSTLFSISCNHLLEIYFSLKMSPWKLESAFEKPCSGWDLNACAHVQGKRSPFVRQVCVHSGFQPLGLRWEEGRRRRGDRIRPGGQAQVLRGQS